MDGVSLVGVTQQFAAQTLKNTSGIVRYGESEFGWLCTCTGIIYTTVGTKPGDQGPVA